jgi:hypothetical protein
MRLRTQVALVGVSIGFVVAYTFIRLLRIPSGRPIPIWPTLTIPFAISIMAAIRSRFVFVPPLAVLFGIVSGSIAFATVRSWPAAEFHIALGIALVLSLPSLFIANWRRKWYVAATREIRTQ